MDVLLTPQNIFRQRAKGSAEVVAGMENKPWQGIGLLGKGNFGELSFPDSIQLIFMQCSGLCMPGALSFYANRQYCCIIGFFHQQNDTGIHGKQGSKQDFW